MFDPIEQDFQVHYTYKLHFTEGLFRIGNPLFKDVLKEYKDAATKLLFVVDKGVSDAHPQLLEDIVTYCKVHQDHLIHTETLVVEGGEQSKNGDVLVHKIQQAVNEDAICRHSFVVAIGGGAVIDMAGYAAATAHRGVKLIRVPTTVLAQNDAAVGVKNSINAFGKKNFLGTFAPPYAIINDSRFLETLEQRDWIAGVAEALKVALIKDAAFFDYLEAHAEKLRNRDAEAMQYTIYKCAEMHMQHIAQGGDPFESGSSRPLDFGHWAAHKLEHMTGYQLRHGEAVAKGIVLDVTYAQLIGLITKTELDRIVAVFEALGFDLSLPIESKEDTERLLQGLEEFREHLGGQLTITLISGIGKKHDVHEIDNKLMEKALHWVNETCNSKV